MKYRKETEDGQLQQMSIDAHIELLKSDRYDSLQMDWFDSKMSMILAENYAYTVKTNVPIFVGYLILFFLFGIAIGRLLP